MTNRITKKAINEIATRLGVNLNDYPVELLMAGAKTEYKEHASRNPKLNVMGDDMAKNIEMALKIALAHFNESVHYYDILDKLEEKLTTMHAKKPNPPLFLKNAPMS